MASEIDFSILIRIPGSYARYTMTVLHMLYAPQFLILLTIASEMASHVMQLFFFVGTRDDLLLACTRSLRNLQIVRIFT